MKKILPVLLSAAFLVCAAGCDETTQNQGSSPKGGTEISLWTYPVGEWGNANAIAPLIAAFNRDHRDITITIETVDYNTGDNAVREAIEEGHAPDLIFEGPERLVAQWGANGLLLPLNDLWEREAMSTVKESVEKTCRKDGKYYIYPICMTTHCMAINYTMFQEADALQYIDEETHTWTTDGFIKAVDALSSYNKAHDLDRGVAAIYCSGQGGDQGTRALVNNLYGGTFADGTVYTLDSGENIEALQLLYDMQEAGKGVRFDPTMNGGDEQTAFCEQKLAMAFCWNGASEISKANEYPEFISSVFPMAFPTKEGNTPSLAGGIWGFGIFDNHDEKRAAAAKEFIRFIGEEDLTRAVTTSSYLPVRDLERNPYENDALMTEYSIFAEYLGDYYQVTPNWADARTAWWNLLQAVGRGEDIATAIEDFPKVQEPKETA